MRRENCQFPLDRTNLTTVKVPAGSAAQDNLSLAYAAEQEEVT
jgi:hypothetical protein